jgi:hypothetical protein
MALGQYPPPWSEGSPDRPGQREPRRFNPMTWMTHPTLKSVFAAFDKTVPPEFWSEDVESDHTVAVVACMCGGEPHVALHRTAFCDGCNRVFWHLGDEIRVARDPSRPETEEGSDAGRKLEADGGNEPQATDG